MAMDLGKHMSTAIREVALQSGIQMSLSNSVWTTLVDGMAIGIVNFLNQRDTWLFSALFSGQQLSDLSSEMLERASVLLAQAAIDAAKREARS